MVYLVFTTLKYIPVTELFIIYQTELKTSICYHTKYLKKINNVLSMILSIQLIIWINHPK